MLSTERPVLSITSPIAVGFSVMGMFAASLFPIWGQATLFCFGTFLFIGGAIRAAWYLRNNWGKRMIGSVLMLVISVILLGGGVVLGWLSIQGIKGAFRPAIPAPGTAAALTPQTIAGAFVEAFDLIRQRNSDQGASPIDLIPRPQQLLEKRAPSKRKTNQPSVIPLPEPSKQLVNSAPPSQIAAPAPALVAVPSAAPSTSGPPSQPLAPRRISDEQKRLLVSGFSALVSNTVQNATIYAVNLDNETYQFSVDLEGVLSRAGLHPQINFKEPDKGQLGTFVEKFTNSPVGISEQVVQLLKRAGIDAKLQERSSLSPNSSAIVIFVSHQD